jgi:putative hydrolase of the HAD superfamily
VFHQDRPFSADEFKSFMFAQSQPYPDMIDLVRRLKAHYGLKIAAVSNEGRELAVYRASKFNLEVVMDFFVVSSFVHYRKPDTDIYRIALDIAQVRPEHVLYVDDRSMFVEVARGLGINGIVHKDIDSTTRAFDALGLVLPAGTEMSRSL